MVEIERNWNNRSNNGSYAYGVKGENGAIFVHLLRPAHFENTTERMIISGNISTSDLQGPMQGKTFDDLQSLFKSLGAYIDIHTKDHPQGELRGTIKFRVVTLRKIGYNIVKHKL